MHLVGMYSTQFFKLILNLTWRIKREKTIEKNYRRRKMARGGKGNKMRKGEERNIKVSYSTKQKGERESN